MIYTQFNAKVQILRSDNGTKYMDGGYVGTWDFASDKLCKYSKLEWCSWAKEQTLIRSCQISHVHKEFAQNLQGR